MFHSGLKKWTKQTVVVYTKDGDALQGVLLAVYDESLKLTTVNIAGPRGGQDVPGEFLVPKSNIRYLQYTYPE